MFTVIFGIYLVDFDMQLNCFLLVAESEYIEDEAMMHNLEYGDDVLMGIFLFECVVKVIAFGFIFAGRTSYIRNSWNVLDFLVICLGCDITIFLTRA